MLVLLRNVVYAETTQKRKECENILLSDETVLKHKQFIDHVTKDLLPRVEEWAISERLEKELPTHGNNTTNYVESSFALTKNIVFNLTKGINICDTLDVLLDNM